MIRAIFNATALLVIIDDDPNMGTTYTTSKVLIDTPQGVADKLLDQGIDIQLLIDLGYIEFPDSSIIKDISNHPDNGDIARKAHVCRIAPKLEQNKMIISCYVKSFDGFGNPSEDYPFYFKSFSITGTEYSDFMSSMSTSTLESWINSKIESLDGLGAFNQ